MVIHRDAEEPEAEEEEPFPVSSNNKTVSFAAFVFLAGVRAAALRSSCVFIVFVSLVSLSGAEASGSFAPIRGLFCANMSADTKIAELLTELHRLIKRTQVIGQICPRASAAGADHVTVAGGAKPQRTQPAEHPQDPREDADGEQE